MMGGRGGRDSFTNFGGSFDSFGAIGSQMSMSSIFGRRDPFFTFPFGRMFGAGVSGSRGSFGDSPQTSGSDELLIEELHSDDEEERDNIDGTRGGQKEDKTQKDASSDKHPVVEHPDDEIDEMKTREVHQGTEHDKSEMTRPQTESFSFRKVTCGGINGAYYTATTTRRTSNDGTVLEECKQADRTTGQATHRVSRGIHDKGHSVTRRLNSDGKVDTMQTLHNLNEDELAGFEQTWNGNAGRHLPARNGGINMNGAAASSSSGGNGSATEVGWALPFRDFPERRGGSWGQNEDGTRSSSGRPKKVVTINIE